MQCLKVSPHFSIVCMIVYIQSFCRILLIVVVFTETCVYAGSGIVIHLTMKHLECWNAMSGSLTPVFILYVCDCVYKILRMDPVVYCGVHTNTRMEKLSKIKKKSQFKCNVSEIVTPFLFYFLFANVRLCM